MKKPAAFAILISTLVVACIVSPSAVLAETAFDHGVQLYKNGKFQEAINAFRSAANQKINQPNSIYYMAMCYQQLGNLQEAHDSYKFVCTRFPNSAVSDRSFAMMKQIGARLQEIADGGDAGSKPVPPPNEPGMEKPKQIVPLGPGAKVVRFTDEAADGRMYVDGTINNKKCKILFDTGAGVTFCRQSFLDKQNWKFDWIDEKATIPGALKEALAKVALVRVSVGGITREVKIYVEQDPPESLYASYDNTPIIGQSFFGDLKYEIDGPRNWIIFRPGGPPPPKNAKIKPAANEVPFVREGHHIIVKTKVNNRECDMYLDTGASQVVFADRHLAQCGLNRPVEATNTVRRTTDGRRDSYAFTIDNIKLGHIEKTEVNAAVLLNSKFSKPLLGQSFLRDLRYTVDPTRNVIRFE